MNKYLSVTQATLFVSQPTDLQIKFGQKDVITSEFSLVNTYWLQMIGRTKVPPNWSNFQYLSPQTFKSNLDKSVWSLVRLPIGQQILTPDWCLLIGLTLISNISAHRPLNLNLRKVYDHWWASLLLAVASSSVCRDVRLYVRTYVRHKRIKIDKWKSVWIVRFTQKLESKLVSKLVSKLLS